MRKIALLLSLILLGSFTLSAQNQRVSGRVTGPDGDPVAGATVIVSGTTIATITDGDGQYSINAPSSGSLDFSLLGMETQNAAISGRTVINVQLEIDAHSIEDVIVVAYGTARRSTFTGAASNVTAEQLKYTPAETADKMLAGKISGVRVASVTGSPGSGGEVNVRGIGSITGSTAPLYVVDGVPISSGNITGIRGSFSTLTSLNPNDIESMTVLKDAAAASIYGSRAANGVIIVTTKSGRAGKTNVSFNASYGVSNMATKSFEVMSGTEYYDYFKVALQNNLDDGGLTPGGYGTDLDGYLQNARRLTRTDGEDWKKFLTRPGSEQNYSVSVTGGGETSRYYIGMSYQDIKGQAINNDMKRYSIAANVTSDINKWLTLEGKAQVSYALTDGARDGYYDSAYSDSGMGSSSIASLIASSNPTMNAYLPDGSVNERASLSSSILSPVYETGEKYIFLKNQNARALVSANAEVRFTDFLKFRTVNGVDFMSLMIREWWGPYTVNGRPHGGMTDDDVYRDITINSANTLQFAKTFGEDHNVDAMVGYEVNSYESYYMNAGGTGYPTDKLPWASISSENEAYTSLTQTFMNSWFLNANYNWSNRYYVGATARTDKSSRLGFNNRRGTFWSVSGSWRISGENFLEGNRTLTNLRLRASYGTNGNQPTNAYDHLSSYTYTGIYGRNSAIYPTRPENRDLGWEKSKNLNIGLDFSLFGRFDFGIEYYNKLTEDLLLDVPSSYGTGFESTLQNSGSIRNRGIEFEFHGNNVLNSDASALRWDTDFLLSTLSAKVVSLPNGDPINRGDVVSMFRFEEGKDLNGMYLPKWWGVNPDNGEGLFYIDSTKAPTTDNLTNNHAQARRDFQGKGYADVFGSWTNTLSWKGLSLSMMLTYQFGGSIYNYWNYFLQSGGHRMPGGFNQGKVILGNYWTKPGDVVDQPRPTISASRRNDLHSTRFMYSSDFIRLKELALAYTLPTSVTSKLGMTNLTVSLSAYNLAFLYAPTKGMELEAPLNGFLSPDLPLARTVTLGLSIGF